MYHPAYTSLFRRLAIATTSICFCMATALPAHVFAATEENILPPPTNSSEQALDQSPYSDTNVTDGEGASLSEVAPDSYVVVPAEPSVDGDAFLVAPAVPEVTQSPLENQEEAVPTHENVDPGLVSTEETACALDASSFATLIENAADSVVELRVIKKIIYKEKEIVASGVVVGVFDGTTAKEAYILTANHVIKDADLSRVDSITIKIYDHTKNPISEKFSRTGKDVSEVAVVKGQDLALLKVNIPKGWAPKTIAFDAAVPAKNTKAAIIGSPLEYSMTAAEVMLDSIRTVELSVLAEPIKVVQFTGAIYPGNSGGPVIDCRGKMVGMVVGMHRDTMFGFAQYGEVIKNFLDDNLPKTY